MSDTTTSDGGPRQKIEELVEDWGRVFPGHSQDVDIGDLIRLNLTIIVAAFGLVAHSILSGDMTFKTEEHEREIVTTLESMLKITSAVGISPEEWDEAIAEIVGPTHPKNDGVFQA